MDKDNQIKDEIRRSALRLLQFTTQICNERQRPGLIAFFKDDIINLTSDDKMNCSLLRLYNTFKTFEPAVLLHLNEFLPQDFKFIISHQNVVQLPMSLLEHQQICSKSHTIPEEDQFDIYLVSLTQLVTPKIAEEFKTLLSRFVMGSSEQRVEVLQFILRSSQLLSDFPELLAGLLEYLNKQWYNYAVEQLKFQTLAQISLNYQVYSETSKPIELFKRVIQVYQRGGLTPEQTIWREQVIAEIQEQTKRVAGISGRLMEQFQGVQKVVKVIKKEPLNNENGSKLAILKDILVDYTGAEHMKNLDQYRFKLEDFFGNQHWRENLLYLAVPVQKEVVLSQIDNYIPFIAQFDSFLIQSIFLQILEKSAKTGFKLHLDDYYELNKIKALNNYIALLNKKQPHITYNSFKFACNTFLNQQQLSFYEQYKSIYSYRSFAEDCYFFNAQALNSYNNKHLKPISYLDEVQQQNQLYEPKVDNQPFSDFEKGIFNMTLLQKLRYSKQIKQQCNNNYKFFHPILSQFQDKQSALNRNYFGSFANGFEAASAVSLNPYQISQLEMETEKVFFEFDEPAVLEEHMMKYDIFGNNVKFIIEEIQIYCDNQLKTFNQQVDLNEEKEYKNALIEDTQQINHHISLPKTCRILLNSIIGDEYYNMFNIYPQISAPFILKRLKNLYLEIRNQRNLVISPIFSKRIVQVYFKSLDFQSRNCIDFDRKIAQIKWFATDLTTKKQSAGMESKLINSITIDNGMPKLWNEIDLTILHFQIAGCKCLYHDGTDKVHTIPDQNIESELNSLIQRTQLSKQTQKIHYCSDIHHVIVNKQKFVQDAYNVSKQLINHPLANSLIDYISTTQNTILDINLYAIFRSILILVDRVSYLLSIAASPERCLNMQKYYFENEKIDFNEIANSFQLYQIRHSIFSEIDELISESSTSQHWSGKSNQMQDLILQNAPEDVFFACFGMRSYISAGIHHLVKNIKKFCEDVFESGNSISKSIFELQFVKKLAFIEGGKCRCEGSLKALQTAMGCVFVVCENTENAIGFSELDM